MKIFDFLLKFYLALSFLYKGTAVVMSHIMGGFDGFGTSVFVLIVLAFMFLYFIRQDRNLAILNLLILLAFVVFVILTDQLGFFTDVPVIVLVVDLTVIGLMYRRARGLSKEANPLP